MIYGDVCSGISAPMEASFACPTVSPVDDRAEALHEA